MKIAITGHTSGIGLALFEYLQAQGHTCIGFSRSTGYDISKPVHRTRILLESLDSDIFVNNAYNDWDNSQLLMLEKIAEAWVGRNKLILNSASKITDGPTPFIGNHYYDTKKSLDNFVNKHQGLPYITNLKLGWVDTPRVKHIDKQKLSVENVAKIVGFIVENKGNLHVNSITVTPIDTA